MDPTDLEKTAFSTNKGLCEWNAMPYGLCSMPVTFCRLMDLVLADICWQKCLVYLDNIVDFGDAFSTDMVNL